jgi:hypothetical protein
MVMGDGLLWALAEWKREVGIGFLSVVVGADGVHPQDHLLAVIVLKKYPDSILK